MVTKQKILIVDDDNNIAELISLYLTKECFETRIVNDGEQALKDFASFQPDLILLDLMLPGIDGYQVCREIRHTSDVPIIMLSAKGETFDKVLGLELGADDYIIKPFDTKELVARVRAVLRRFKVRQPAGNPDEKCVSFPDLTINLTNYSVTYMGKQIDMPPKELELLYFLAASPNQVFTREQLLDHIWGYEYIGDTRTVDVHIKRLLKKSKTILNGVSLLYGVSDTSLRSKTNEKETDNSVFTTYILLGVLGFLLVTYVGSHLLENRLEKSISADMYQTAHRIAENNLVSHNITSSNMERFEQSFPCCKLS